LNGCDRGTLTCTWANEDELLATIPGTLFGPSVAALAVDDG
jgi:hypothetical protein